MPAVKLSERGKTLIVSAGLGTSIVPLRIGTQPDVWLITLKRGKPVAAVEWSGLA